MNALNAAALVIVVCVVLVALRRDLRSGPSPFTRALRPRRREPAPRPAALVELERVTRFSLDTAGDVHFRLRPALREIALERLAARNVDLDADGKEARRILGSEAWDLLRGDRPPPPDRHAPGISREVLTRVVRALEDV